jgi:hypothetical protein
VDPDIQQRIDELYADIKPLQDYFGIKPKTIDERYQEHLKKKALAEESDKPRPKPRFKLPKL